jgi:hypothetical protein
LRDEVLSAAVSIYNWLVSAYKARQSLMLTLHYRDLCAMASLQLKVGGFYHAEDGCG